MEMYLKLGELFRCFDILSISGDLRKFGKQVEARDPHIRKTGIANVCMGAIDLWTNLTHFNTRHQAPFVITELYHETMKAVILAVQHQPCKYDSMSACIHPSWPPLQRRQCRRMDDKLISGMIKSC